MDRDITWFLKRNKSNEVLIKVRATTVTSTDCNVRNFTFVPGVFQLPARLFMFGVFKPRIHILGIDLAGEIEAVGQDVQRFKKGDQVFGTPGMTLGAHAEYTCVPEDGALTIKPPGMAWEEAAAIFLGASTALFYLRDKGQIQVGHKALIYGASGAIGTYAVQLAKYFGAEVTGVCSTTNVTMVQSLGADKVIDHTKEDYGESGETYDLVLDTVGKTSFAHCKKSLTQKGVFLPVVMDLAELVQIGWTSMTGGKRVKGGVAGESVEDLEFFKELFEAGKLKPVIDRCYPLEQVADAFRYVEKGHKKGNVVITVGE
ncbi:MAG: NAD(P)-dependent alcohol dehydrogenase [Candidatus Electrothrix sp. AR4]|nr:NAD(P)-dependent alcohol dehydrogenase [Candidatus Electrothrix sp. AR4]